MKHFEIKEQIMKEKIFEVNLTELGKARGEQVLMTWLSKKIGVRWTDKALVNQEAVRKAVDAIMFLDEYHNEKNEFRKESMKEAAYKATGALYQSIEVFNAAQKAIDEAKREKERQKVRELQQAAEKYEQEIVPLIRNLVEKYQPFREIENRWNGLLSHDSINFPMANIVRAIKRNEIYGPLFKEYRDVPRQA